jgi:hypothetical protein
LDKVVNSPGTEVWGLQPESGLRDEDSGKLCVVETEWTALSQSAKLCPSSVAYCGIFGKLNNFSMLSLKGREIIKGFPGRFSK